MRQSRLLWVIRRTFVRDGLSHSALNRTTFEAVDYANRPYVELALVQISAS